MHGTSKNPAAAPTADGVSDARFGDQSGQQPSPVCVGGQVYVCSVGAAIDKTVSHETSREHSRRRDGLCPCGTEPRMPGQAYGLKCHAAYQRRWRALERETRAAEREELARLRAEARSDER